MALVWWTVDSEGLVLAREAGLRVNRAATHHRNIEHSPWAEGVVHLAPVPTCGCAVPRAAAAATTARGGIPEAHCVLLWVFRAGANSDAMATAHTVMCAT